MPSLRHALPRDLVFGLAGKLGHALAFSGVLQKFVWRMHRVITLPDIPDPVVRIKTNSAPEQPTLRNGSFVGTGGSNKLLERFTPLGPSAGERSLISLMPAVMLSHEAERWPNITDFRLPIPAGLVVGLGEERATGCSLPLPQSERGPRSAG